MPDNPRVAVAYHFVSNDVARERQFSLPEGAVYSTPVISGPMDDKQKVETKQNNWNKLTLDQ